MIVPAAIAFLLTAQCEAYDGNDYDRGVIVEENFPKVWNASDIPLVVVLDSDLVALEPLVQEAIAWWSGQVGFNPFLYAGMLPVKTGIDIRGAIPIYELNDAHPNDGDTVLLPKVGMVEVGAIGVKADLAKTPDKALRVLKHELGHLLGLAHDKDPKSIMSASGDVGDQVTINDRKLLKELYGSGRRKPQKRSDGRKYIDQGGSENPNEGGRSLLRI
jgi:hypothetical protein